MSDMILSELKDAAIDWSDYMRRNRSGWPSISLLGRVVELGSDGAASKSNKQPAPPLVPMSDYANMFDRVYQELRESDRDVLTICYVKRADPKKKAEALNCSVATMYNRRNKALVNMIPGWLSLTKERF